MNRLLIAALLRALAACATAPGVTTSRGTPHAVPALSPAVVLTKLDSPWEMAFLPNGTMFFTEKCLGLSVRQPRGAVVKLLGMKDAKGYATSANDLFCKGQAGMAGVAVDPGFSSNPYIYVYSTSSITAPGTNRVMRLKVNEGMTAVSHRSDIFADIQYKPRASDHPSVAPARTTAVDSASARVTVSCA